MKAITKADLKNQQGPGERPILHCQQCGGDYSANRGDYFALPDTYVFKCCARPLRLVFKRTIYVEATP